MSLPPHVLMHPSVTWANHFLVTMISQVDITERTEKQESKESHHLTIHVAQERSPSRISELALPEEAALDLYSLLPHSSHHPPGPTASEGPLCLRVTVFVDSCLPSMSSPLGSIPTTSISWGCHDSLPHTWGLQTTAISSLTVWRPEV